MKSIIDRQRGLSLVELLVALALSAVLATGLYRIVLANQQSMALTDTYARAQEAARSALDLLQFDMRMAGFQGCVNDITSVNNGLATNPATGYDPLLHDFAVPIQVFDNYDPLVNPSIAGVQPAAGTDVFISRAAISSDLYVAKTPATTAAALQVAGPLAQLKAIKEGSVVMVSDCENADIFAVSGLTGAGSRQLLHNTNVSDGPNNAGIALAEQYAHGSQILLMNTVAYFVAPSQLVKTADGTAVNSLYRVSAVDGGTAMELVPYIDDMQLRYGVDTDNSGSPDTYLTGQQILSSGLAMASDVYAVHIELTVITEQSCPAGSSGNQGCLQPKRYQSLVYIRNSTGGV